MVKDELKEDMFEATKYVLKNVREHQDWFKDSIPLIASENVPSPLVRELLTSDFHNRYAEGLPGARYYQGNIYVDDVERLGIELAKKLFKSKYADLRPTSGTTANLGMFFALAEPGDHYTSYDVADGAHISSAKFGGAGLRGLVEKTYPFNEEEMNLDIDETIKVIKEWKPKIALFGCSVYLFPTPLKELQEAFDETGTFVVYDGAHVLGLIAHGRFQDPLREGAEVITGSTHKTFPGPQGGILISNPRDKEMEEKLIYGIFPGVLSNHHLHHMAAKVISLAEHIEFGAQYADQVIKNAKALASALSEEGFKLLAEGKGYTKSHTIVMDVRELGGAAKLVEDLEAANIITNKNLLPWDDVDMAMNPSGIRLGSQELTRVGMKEDDMKEVAKLFREICIDKKEISEVKRKVKDFKSEFTTVQYCFQDGEEAYDYLAPYSDKVL